MFCMQIPNFEMKFQVSKTALKVYEKHIPKEMNTDYSCFTCNKYTVRIITMNQVFKCT